MNFQQIFASRKADRRLVTEKSEERNTAQNTQRKGGWQVVDAGWPKPLQGIPIPDRI